jgi:nicotinate-nucleotide pyrophosphorylase (carboxylating)
MTIDEIIKNALYEDIGDGDHSSLACIPSTATGKVRLLIKEDGVLAGIEIAKKVFNAVDSTIKVNILLNDGSSVKKGDIALIAEGKEISLLTSERTVLNFMQRMSGIATFTRKAVKFLEGLNTKILDTRKTTPNFRLLEKEAVRIGGGQNHRMGLYDMIMLKDNHIDFAGGIRKAIEATQLYLKQHNKNLKIEIETRNINEVKEVLSVGNIDRIMLDNFAIPELKEAVLLINHKYETEASGGINLENIRQYAECGVDFISLGALTHQIKSLDMSLKAMN